MTESYVRHDVKNGIATIEFYTPAHNSLPSTILKTLAQTITHCGNNPDVRVIILRSAGNRTFCAGASFDELLSITTERDGLAFFSGFANVINAMRSCSKLIIGRVQGKAVGGGVGIAAATDYCFATQHAAIKLSELTIGIGPFVIEPAVSRKIGQTATSELTINATAFYPASWANEKGLYARVFDNAEDLDKAMKQLAQQLASYNPEAVTAMKTVLWKGTDHWETLLPQRAAISGRLVLSDFTKETLQTLKK